MFKKEQDLAERCRTCLKNKDTRKLKTDILSQFPRLEESQLATLFGNSNVTHAKLASRTIIYLVDDVPLFFDHSGRNNLFPTIFTLWLFPNMLRNYIIYAPVSSFIIKGADLMLPGLATYTGLEGCKENEKMCIRVHGNPLPFAVGTSLKNWESIENVVRKGRILSLLHVYNDCLALSNKKSVSNSGFGGTRIYPIEDFVDIGGNVIGESNGGLEEEEEEEEEEKEDDNDNEEEEEDGGGDDHHHPEVNDDNERSDNNNFDDLENNNNNDDNNTNQQNPLLFANETAEEKLSSQKVDEILQTSLLLSLKYVIKDKQLPLLASSFWALLLRCTPPEYVGNESIDIKKSSFKKVSVFLKSMEKLGLLITKEQNGILSVISVERVHSLFRGIKVDDPESFKSNALNSEDSNNSNDSNKKGMKLSVVQLYKCPKHIKDIFGNIRGTYGEYLKSIEIKDMLVMYIKSKDLEVDDNRSCVCIPIMEPLHKIAQLAEKEKNKKELKIISDNQKVEEQQLKEKLDATLAIDLDDNKYDEDDYDSNFNSLSGSGYSSVGGVMMPSVINMGTAVWGSNKNNSSSKDDWPSIGGLTLNSGGADKSKLKPVFLSSSTSSNISKVLKAKNGIISSESNNEKNNKNKILPLQQVGIWDLSNALPAPPVKGIGIVITKEILLHALISQLSQYFAFVNSDGTVTIRSGTLPAVDITVEAKMGNKTITKVRGLEIFGFDISVVTKEFQKKYACSCTISSVKGFPKEKEIVMQGHLSFEVESYLTDILTIPRHLIVVKVLKGVKQKKK